MNRVKTLGVALAITIFTTGRLQAHENDGGGLSWGSLIVPFGIATLTLLLLTASAGLLARKKPKLFFKWHKRLAITTIVVALCHATLVLLSSHDNENHKETPMEERTGLVTMKGNPVTLVGNEVKPGDPAPDFTVLDNDLSPVKFSSFRGKVCIISSVPSLDTAVCDLETRKFNQEAEKLGSEVVVLTISMDLPFAQKRWCGQAGVTRVKVLSDHRDASFGTTYGVLIKQLRLLARAVFVVDNQGTVRYVQLVKEISQEPDYDAVLSAVRKLM